MFRQMGEAAIDQDDYMRSLKQARCWHLPAVPQRERERVGECGDTKRYNDKVANQELKIKCLCNQWSWNGVDMRRRANLIRDFFGPAWLFHVVPQEKNDKITKGWDQEGGRCRCAKVPDARWSLRQPRLEVDRSWGVFELWKLYMKVL